MKKILLFLMIFSSFIVEDIKAQNHAWCGTTEADQFEMRDRLIANRERYANQVQVRNGITWVPIKFHILTDNNGGNRVDLLKVYETLCAVNEDYAPYEIQFYQEGDFNYINSTSVNSNPNLWNPITQNVFVSNKVAGAVNLFIARDIPSDDPNSNISTLGFYQTGWDWVVIRRDQMTAAKAETVTHELGHFFTLPHPFLGWGPEAYDAAVYGNPAPATSPGGNSTEKMDGSNCASAGDAICDTRPNYLFGLSWPNGNCNYTGGVMDPMGTLVDPQENNFMAYFIGCGSEFTPEQIDRVLDDMNSRVGLLDGINPDNTPITDAPNLVYPINSESTPAYNWVGLDWDPVPGATAYLVEVDKTTSFNFAPSSQLVTGGTYVEFSGIFEANKTYNWRVKPLKLGNVCGPISTTGKFTTGESTSINEISEILDYSIAPNPLSSKETLNINIETNQGFEATIFLYDLSGKKIKAINQNFGFGTSNYELSVNGLSRGMYLLSIQTETGILNEKIIITQ